MSILKGQVITSTPTYSVGDTRPLALNTDGYLFIHLGSVESSSDWSYYSTVTEDVTVSDVLGVETTRGLIVGTAGTVYCRSEDGTSDGYVYLPVGTHALKIDRLLVGGDAEKITLLK